MPHRQVRFARVLMYQPRCQPRPYGPGALLHYMSNVCDEDSGLDGRLQEAYPHHAFQPAYNRPPGAVPPVAGRCVRTGLSEGSWAKSALKRPLEYNQTPP